MIEIKGTCRLCLKQRKLCNSHIVPEFLYSDLYNDKHQIMAINGTGSRGWKPVQKGLYDKLLCASCESDINDNFEKPFRFLWVENSPLPNPWNMDGVYVINVDYEKFKLFHLSVLFRASVSSLIEFSKVDLGPHEELIRRLLLECDPGKDWQYQIFGSAVIQTKSKRLVPMVSQAFATRLNGQRCYGMMYGGVHWWFCVASNRNGVFDQVALQPDGRLGLVAVPWTEVPAMQLAKEALLNPVPYQRARQS